MKVHNILVTRELSDEQLLYAENLGLNVIVEPAIRFKFRDNWSSVVSVIESAQNPVFAFTSRNGVEGLRRLMDQGYKPPSNAVYYAVGEKTAEALSEIGFQAVVPEVQYGEVLGRKIAGDIELTNLSEVMVLHFCGNRRREEMRQVLESSDITVKDIVVYETKLNRINPDLKDVEGILFYSPSAVEAFRKSGGFMNSDLPELFAIGRTTGQELSIESGQNVHISPEPNTSQFLKFTARMLNEISSGQS